MKVRWFRRLLPGLMVLTLAGSANAQPLSPFVPGPWWRDFQKTLGLTDDQSNRIEAVFQTALPELRHKRDELAVQEAELSRLINADADEGAIVKQSDRVEAVRTILNKNRTLMLVRMRAIMSPDQRARLNTLREQWDKDHAVLPRRPGPSNTPH